MTDSLLERERDLVWLQCGVITRQQALAAGLTRKAIESRVASGRWQRLYDGVYATFSGQVPRPAGLWAAVLRAGPAAVLSHQTAAELHGLLDVPAELIHVTVPSGRQVARPPLVVIHYSGRLAQSRHPALAPPRTRVADTILDLAGSAASADDAVGFVLRAIGRRRITADQLTTAIGGRSRIRWRADLLRAAGAGGEGAHSLLEYRYGTRVEACHGLPRGKRQHPAARSGRREYQDIAYERYLTVVELDGQAAHPAEARWLDVGRDNANAASGHVTLRFGWADVSQRACLTAAMVGGTLAHRGWQGKLRRCGAACPLRSDHPLRSDPL